MACLLTVAVAGCSAAVDPEADQDEATASSSASLRALRPVQLTEADDQQSIVMTEGRPLEVLLASNVTTGFDWRVARVDRTLGLPEITHVPGEGLGAPGTTIFTWQTASCPTSTRGRHAVELEYRRPWETGVPPQKVFRFVVDVRAAGRVVVLDEADDGARLDVLAGTSAEAALHSNPTTGYDWLVKSTTPALPAPTITFTPDSPRVGAGGTTHLRWSTRPHGAVPPGDYAVELAYERPWETGVPPLRAFTFRLTVSPTR